jgi:hypothetical protein
MKISTTNILCFLLAIGCLFQFLFFVIHLFPTNPVKNALLTRAIDASCYSPLLIYLSSRESIQKFITSSFCFLIEISNSTIVKEQYCVTLQNLLESESICYEWILPGIDDTHYLEYTTIFSIPAYSLIINSKAFDLKRLFALQFNFETSQTAFQLFHPKNFNHKFQSFQSLKGPYSFLNSRNEIDPFFNTNNRSFSDNFNSISAISFAVNPLHSIPNIEELKQVSVSSARLIPSERHRLFYLLWLCWNHYALHHDQLNYNSCNLAFFSEYIQLMDDCTASNAIFFTFELVPSAGFGSEVNYLFDYYGQLSAIFENQQQQYSFHFLIDSTLWNYGNIFDTIKPFSKCQHVIPPCHIRETDGNGCKSLKPAGKNVLVPNEDLFQQLIRNKHSWTTRFWFLTRPIAFSSSSKHNDLFWRLTLYRKEMNARIYSSHLKQGFESFGLEQINKSYYLDPKEYDEQTKKMLATISNLKAIKFPFSGPFIGIHIRRGDKIKEVQYISMNKYYESAIKLVQLLFQQSEMHFTSLNEFIIAKPPQFYLFVCSDDVRTVNEFSQHFPDWPIVTLNSARFTENAMFQIGFLEKSIDDQWEHDYKRYVFVANYKPSSNFHSLLKVEHTAALFVAELELMRLATFCIVSSSSNVGKLVQRIRTAACVDL